jgi:hypothetical protein
MLMLAEAQGYFTGYRGIRISATGRRFLVRGATVWNVVDQEGPATRPGGDIFTLVERAVS